MKFTAHSYTNMIHLLGVEQQDVANAKSSIAMSPVKDVPAIASNIICRREENFKMSIEF